MNHPGSCPHCGPKHKDLVEIVDDDGNKKYYSCEKCHMTWMQYGFSGKPLVNSFAGGNKVLYKAFINTGYTEAKARNLVFAYDKQAKIVKIDGESWQINGVYSVEKSAVSNARKFHERGLTVKIKKTTTKTGPKWVIYVRFRR
jgi:hypothetical protein